MRVVDVHAGDVIRLTDEDLEIFNRVGLGMADQECNTPALEARVADSARFVTGERLKCIGGARSWVELETD